MMMMMRLLRAIGRWWNAPPVWSPDDILMNARIYHSMDAEAQKCWTLDHDGMLVRVKK